MGGLETRVKNRVDNNLKDYLGQCDTEVFDTCLRLLYSELSVDCVRLDPYVKGGQATPDKGTPERADLAEFVVLQIRYFGSDTGAYLLRIVFSDEPGVTYLEVARDVAKDLNRHLKKKRKIPRLVLADDLEHLIVEQILDVSFQGKSQEQVIEMLESAGLDKDAAVITAKKIATVGVGGGLLLALVKLLGKNTVKAVIQNAVVWMLAKRIGKEAALKFAGKALGKVAAKRIAGFLAGVGWALLAVDAYSFVGGPAKRVTIPFVAFVAVSRVVHRDLPA